MRFLNILKKREIKVTDIRAKENELEFSLSIRKFFFIRSIAKKTGVKIKIRQKVGFPFWYIRFRNRKIFLAGFILMLATLYTFSLYVWKIEIDAYGEADPLRVKQQLLALGIHPGLQKKKISVHKLPEMLLSATDNYAWVFAQFQGATLKVSVATKKRAPELFEKKRTDAILAKKDAFISKVVVKSGSARVKPGDTVKKGDILIAGETVYKDGSKKEVAALGEILARTWYSTKGRIESYRLEKIRTGKVFRRFAIGYGENKIFLFNPAAYAENYDKIETDLTGGTFAKIGLPLEIQGIVFYENKESRSALDEETALGIARNEAKMLLEQVLPKEALVVSQQEWTKSEPQGNYLELITECLEEIGEKQPLGGPKE